MKIFQAMLFLSSLTASAWAVVCIPEINITTEVLVIGAGMSGLAAAKTLKDNGITPLIVESTNRLGGRILTKTDFGTLNTTVELGAGWVYDSDEAREFLQLTKEYGVDIVQSDYFDFASAAYVYNDDTANGTAARFSRLQIAWATRRFRHAWECLQRRARWEYLDIHIVEDTGARDMLRKCGWEITRARNKKLESLRALVQWIYLQFEYAEEDVSLYTFPEDIYASPNYQIVDQEGGYEKVPKTYASIHELEGLITYNTRVQHIKYDVGGDSSRAYVIAENTTDASCTGYFAERVISTLPAPIYNEGLVTFDPPLKYSPDEYSPFEMKVYMRIYYEFADQDKFWDDSEYIFSGKEGGELAIRGTCHNWQNMDFTINRRNPFYNREGTTDSFIPGSHTLLCTLLQEDFAAALGVSEEEMRNNDLTDDQLMGLLDPLRKAYGDDFKEPTAVYLYPWHKNVDSGYGSYANWQVGRTVKDYFRFFGTLNENLVAPCDHNGCDDDDWIVHISGTLACFEKWEFVHSAYDAGIRSARIVAASLGKNVDAIDALFPCEDFWGWYEPEEDGRRLRRLLDSPPRRHLRHWWNE